MMITKEKLKYIADISMLEIENYETLQKDFIKILQSVEVIKNLDLQVLESLEKDEFIDFYRDDIVIECTEIIDFCVDGIVVPSVIQ